MLDITKIYSTNSCGSLKVVKYHNSKQVDVEFIYTGYRTTTQAHKIRDGNVKDKLFPSVYGTGFVSEGKYRISILGKITKVYQTWRGMLERCYSNNYLDKNPTYRDCTVTKEWHNFQVYAEWFEDNYIEGYQLDKDIKVKGNKVYSPETCMFVSAKENTIAAHAKHYTFINPAGELIELYNLAKFCRENNLNSSLMSKLHLGKAKQHKGWHRAVEYTTRYIDT